MMPERTERYRKHEIRVFVMPNIDIDSTYCAVYEAKPVRSERPITGVIAGAFPALSDAGDGALKAAKYAVDKRMSLKRHSRG